MTRVLIRERRDAWALGGEGDVRMEAEIQATFLQAQEHEDSRQPPEARTEARNRFSLRASRRNQPCRHLDSKLPDFRTVRRYISTV